MKKVFLERAGHTNLCKRVSPCLWKGQDAHRYAAKHCFWVSTMSLQLLPSPLGPGHWGGTWEWAQKRQLQVPDLPQLGVAVQSHQADSEVFALLIWIPFNGYQITPPWWLPCCCCPQAVAVQMERAVPEESRNTGILSEKGLPVGQGCKAPVTELFPLHPACGGPGLVEQIPGKERVDGDCQCRAVNPKLWELPASQLTGSVGKGLIRVRCNAESLLLLLCKIKNPCEIYGS